MGNRLSKIYTRTGDKGTTGLGDGSRVDKDSRRVCAYGSSDELNSIIGMVLAEDCLPDFVRRVLNEVQHQLFDLGSSLAVPGYDTITAAHIDWLEQVLDKLNADLPYLKEFILPAGGRATSACHLARTVCRRCEREIVGLGRELADRGEELPANSLAYVNRLSDLLFVICRVLARVEGGAEVLWQRNRPPLPLD